MGSLITNFIVPGPQKRPKIACTEARGERLQGGYAELGVGGLA